MTEMIYYILYFSCDKYHRAALRMELGACSTSISLTSEKWNCIYFQLQGSSMTHPKANISYKLSSHFSKYIKKNHSHRRRVPT